MSMSTDLRDAKAFAEQYEPAEDDHPDLHSRVVMYRRAVEDGDKRKVAVHARTLTRFARNIGALTESTSSTSDGPTKADLVAEARSLGLPTSGSKGDLLARIDAHRAGQDS